MGRLNGSEDDYDNIIAPMLLAVAKRCEELGMSLIARVEWQPGESGITQIGDLSTIGQTLTQYAAHSHGNIDKLCLSLIKNRDVSASMFLNQYQTADARRSLASGTEGDGE